MFVDYSPTNPMPPRATCTTAPSGTPQRTSQPCSIQGICELADIGITEKRQLEIVVFDRMPLDTGTPLYQAMPADGLSTTWMLTLTCAKKPS
jgi:hypothetical protein